MAASTRRGVRARPGPIEVPRQGGGGRTARRAAKPPPVLANDKEAALRRLILGPCSAGEVSRAAAGSDRCSHPAASIEPTPSTPLPDW